MSNLKFNLFFTISVFLFVSDTYAREEEKMLREADSLYESRNYAIALKMYDELVQERNYVTPAVLLKMALISRITDNTVLYIYALSMYNYKYHDRDMHDLMVAEARKKGLSGFEVTDIEYFMDLYRRYHPILLVTAIVLSLVLGLYTAARRLAEHAYPRSRLVLAMAAMAIPVMLYFFGPDVRQAIVASPNALLMTEPSAASACVGTAPQGNRINILGEDDIWYEVSYQNKNYFIRQNNLLVIK